MVETRDFATVLLERLDDLSPKQVAIARYLLQTPGFAMVATARDIAANVGVDPGTVVRFAQALGFKGYADLRQHLRHRYLSSLSPQALTVDQGHELAEYNVVAAMLHLDVTNLRLAAETLDLESINRLADFICSGRRLLLVSSGSYAAPGVVFAHLCQSMGYDVDVELRGGTYLSARLTTLKHEDGVMGIGFWRGYRETLTSISWARQRGLWTFALTDTVASPLALAAERVLIVPTEGLFFFQSMTAAMSCVYGVASLIWLRGGDRAQGAMEGMRELYGQFGTFLDEEGQGIGRPAIPARD